MNITERKITEAKLYILSQIKYVPETAIVLGSGLGDFADNLSEKVIVEYKDIPNFPVSTVPGHAGRLICGKIDDKYVLVMQGRFHYYEGYSMQDIVLPVQTFAALGVKKLILTCAVGAINTDFSPADLVILTDHIKFSPDNPLRGANPENIGDRFFDMSNAYSKEFSKVAEDVANQNNINIQKGVYAYMGGPNFETPAEIRMLRILGADVVGMSTVPEVIAAHHAGLETLAIACVSNMAAGILDQPLTHEEVLETAEIVSQKFKKLLFRIIKY
jgi:purine-nucleoside phosphorylase